MSIKLKVLIVEDDFMIADMAEEFLIEHGFDVCGTAGRVEEAVALGQLLRPDLALLDCRLAEGGLGTEVATRLLALGDVGILYATGNSTTGALKDADGMQASASRTAPRTSSVRWRSSRISRPMA